MKLITAFIKPHRIDDVMAALRAVGAQGATVSEVRGVGRQRGQRELYRGAEYTHDAVPKTRIEVLCETRDVDGFIDALVKAARTQSIGDGKIVVTPVERIVRIRTGEAGPDALS